MAYFFFIQEHLHRKVNHGGIGNADADKVWLQLGYTPVFFPAHNDFSIKGKIKRIGYLLKMLLTIRTGSTVVFQFPLYAGMNRMLIRLLSLRKNIQLICFVTDIDGIKDGNPELLSREIKTLKQFRYFIVHNQAMEEWLLGQVPAAMCSRLNFFDFLASPFSGERNKSNRIVFAGNLSKSLFLEHLDELSSKNLIFNLYGPGLTPGMKRQSSISFKGEFDPYTLPSRVEGSFGLVWDGDSIHGSSGVFGHYMAYITHHKVSLYILSGLPIICFQGAGVAPLVAHYQIGMLVAGLEEVADKIEQLPEETYQQMHRNMMTLAGPISQGKCLAGAMQKLSGKNTDHGPRTTDHRP